MQENSKDLLVTFEQLKTIAKLQLERSSHTLLRRRSNDSFAALDADEDGYITKDELLESRTAADFGKKFMKRVFEGLDTDRDGYISFQEFMPIFYLSTMCSTRKCKACRISLVYGLAYSCIKCFTEDRFSEFSVCHRCFKSQKFQHPQHETCHMLHDFSFFHNLLQMAVSPPPASPLRAPPPQQLSVQMTMQQCIVCGDFHTSTTTGFMCDAHMSAVPGSTNYVCEWCFCYFCFRCGNPFRDNISCATPAKWLQRFICITCSQQPPHDDLYHTIIQRYQHLLKNAEILEQCKTCLIKQKNGTLFWYVNGTNVLGTNNALIVSSPLFQDNCTEIQLREPYRFPVQNQSLQHQLQSHSSNTYFQTPQSQGHYQYQPQVQTIPQLPHVAYQQPKLQQQRQPQSQGLTKLADFTNVATTVASNVAVAISQMLAADVARDIINDNN